MRWDWTEVCGPDGFHVWSAKTHDLGICFQELCLQTPVLALLAITSAYHFGRQINRVQRGRRQIRAVNIRCVLCTAFAILPILQVYAALESSANMNVIYYFLSMVQGLAWLCHLCYNLKLRHWLTLSARGFVSVIVEWSSLAVLSVISLRSHSIVYHQPGADNEIVINYGFSIARLIFHIVYALTLVPNDGDTEYVHYSEDLSESQALLASGNQFSRFREEQDPTYLGVAMEDTTCLSRLIFHWVNPMMEKGASGKLDSPDDLYDLPDNLNPGYLSHKINKALKNIPKSAQPYEAGSSHSLNSIPDVTFSTDSRRPQRTLFVALHKCFWVQFYSIGVLKLIADCSGFAGPMLLNRLVGFIEDKGEDVRLGYAYAAGLFFTALLAAFCNAHFNFLMASVGLKIRAALVTTVYKKTLSVGSTTLNSAFNVGEIVNFMSTDTERVVNSCPSFHALWSIPFQIAVTLYLLYAQVGLAFLAGVAFTIILIPINKFIANKIGSLSTKMMAAKDNRVKLMMEILRGMRTIKLHVWESYFSRVITKIRDQELKYLKGRKYLDALCVYFWATTPILISIFTFTTYILMGNKLTAATVFTTIALLNMLIAPLNAFPWVLNGLTEAWVSLQRIQKLLELPDLIWTEYYDRTLVEETGYSLVVRDGKFNWGKLLSNDERRQLHSRQLRSVKDKGKGKKSSTSRADQQQPDDDNILRDFYLENLNLNIEKGEFVGIMGTVGGGKSSILSAILAELTKQDGRIGVANLEQGFGYVAQQPWLQRGTIRENILFCRSYDEDRYLAIVNACGLSEDFASLPAGDLTGVGEAGMTLSGGQKARVALARAVYQDRPIYLLDDIISAVDAHVAKHIFHQCILGLLRNKTVILCTHNVQYLSRADRIVVIENGTITKQGKPADVLADIDDLLPIDLELGESFQSSLTLSASLRTIETDKDDDSILNEESHETGSVRTAVYFAYWRAVGHLLSLAIVLSIVLMQTSRNLTDWWLSYWVTSEENKTAVADGHANWGTSGSMQPIYQASNNNTPNGNIDFYLIIYGTLAGANTIFTLFRAFLFAYGGIVAATIVHKLLLKNIIKSKMTFFEITPLGRILNRFSSDTYTIDDSLPFILNILFAQLFGLLGAIIITLYGLPWLSLVLVPLIPVYSWLQHHYRLTSRELKRISSVSLSPVYSHFNETLQGLSTIRAFRATKRFRRDNEAHVEINQKAQFASQAAAQWLGLRLQFIGVAMITGVGLLAVIQHQFDVADPGLVGLAISYALSVTGLLNGVVNAFTETEREMIAVERVNQYIEIVVPERTNEVMVPPYAWPLHGVITFQDVVLKYREHLVPSLKGVSFTTQPGEKIGVVGRTGAGKSSLLAALFRLVELHSGFITIDSVNISHISISALRLRVSCIPQEPFLFSGTVRENLDPLSENRDSEIWSALSKVDLQGTIRRMGGLEQPISSGGANLSAGQRQLFCLARALLRNTKILCIDEATANVDQETDRQIQQTLRSAFRKCTVITIAHRIQTVMDCDSVLVMADGQAVEFDSPETLLRDTNSYFYQLVNNE